jgi:transketolase
MTKQSMRAEYGKCLVEAGERHANLVALDADLKESTQSIQFEEQFPDRYFDIGIAEQNMVGIAAGLALGGKLPVVHSFATFISMRACEQVRTTVAYPNLNVKFVVSHGGISCGSAGATHHSIEDVAIMRSIPNMTVIVPSDAVEVRQAFLEALTLDGPVYIRMTADDVETVTEKHSPFTIGKARYLKDGGAHATIISTGTMAPACLEAADLLGTQYDLSVSVMSMASIKPIDTEAILDAAEKSGLIVTVEEHSLIGGLGSAVSEVVSGTGSGRVIRMGVGDRFCGIGSACYLLEEEGLSSEHIYRQILNEMNIEAK